MIDAVTDCSTRYSTAPRQIAQIMRSSEAGATVFRAVGMNVGWRHSCEDLQRSVEEELCEANWDVKGWRNFKEFTSKSS